jgi:predicted DNA-binding protein YlxM (UPF0122 family)
METLFACLPERQRSVLWLAAVEGYSVEEIAEILETSIRSVKSLVHRARAGLAESPGETARIERNIDRWREMSESERKSAREQMKRFRAISVEDRLMLLDAWVGPEPAESFSGSGAVDESSEPSGQIRSSGHGAHAIRLALIQHRKEMIPAPQEAHKRG